MLSLRLPSLLVMFVASMPLKNRLVDVVRVPFTDGDWFPLPFTPTGDSSVETPASEPSNPVKLRTDVGVRVNCSPVICREVVADSVWISGWSFITSTKMSVPPTSSETSSERDTEASTSVDCRTDF